MCMDEMHDWKICFWQNLLEGQLHHLLIGSIPQCKSRSMDNSDAWEARLSWRSAFARRPHQIVASTVPSAFVSQMHSILHRIIASKLCLLACLCALDLTRRRSGGQIWCRIQPFCRNHRKAAEVLWIKSWEFVTSHKHSSLHHTSEIW